MPPLTNSQKNLRCLKQLVDFFLEDDDGYGIHQVSFLLSPLGDPKLNQMLLARLPVTSVLLNPMVSPQIDHPIRNALPRQGRLALASSAAKWKRKFPPHRAWHTASAQ